MRGVASSSAYHQSGAPSADVAMSRVDPSSYRTQTYDDLPISHKHQRPATWVHDDQVVVPTSHYSLRPPAAAAAATTVGSPPSSHSRNSNAGAIINGIHYPQTAPYTSAPPSSRGAGGRAPNDSSSYPSSFSPSSQVSPIIQERQRSQRGGTTTADVTGGDVGGSSVSRIIYMDPSSNALSPIGGGSVPRSAARSRQDPSELWSTTSYQQDVSLSPLYPPSSRGVPSVPAHDDSLHSHRYPQMQQQRTNVSRQQESRDPRDPEEEASNVPRSTRPTTTTTSLYRQPNRHAQENRDWEQHAGGGGSYVSFPQQEQQPQRTESTASSFTNTTTETDNDYNGIPSKHYTTRVRSIPREPSAVVGNVSTGASDVVSPARQRGATAGATSPLAVGSNNATTTTFTMQSADQIQNRCLMLASCLEHTTTERDALTDMISNLTSYRDSLLQDLEALRGENKSVTEIKDSLQRLLEVTKSQLENTTKALGELRVDKQDVDVQLVRSIAKSDSLEQENKALLEQCDQLRQSVRNTEGKLENERRACEEVAAALEEAEATIARLERDAEESKIIEEQMADMVLKQEEEVDREHKEHSSVSRTNGQLQRQLDDVLERERSALKSLEALTKANEELRRDLKRVIAQGEKDATEVCMLRTEIAGFREKEVQWLTQRESLEVQKGSAQGSTEQLIVRCADLKEQLASVEARLVTSQERCNGLQAAEAETRTRLQFAEERTDTSLAALTSEQQRVVDLQQQLSESIANVERLSECLSTARSTSNALQLDVAATEEALQGCQEELAKSRLRVQELETAAQATNIAHDIAVADLRRALDHSSIQLEELQATSKNLHALHSLLLQTSSAASSQRDFATTKMTEWEHAVDDLKAQLAGERHAKAELLDELHHAREAEAQLLHRVAHLEQTIEHTNDLLAATRADRDVLVSEMRRSQQLWTTMSEEQVHMRNTRAASSGRVASPPLEIRE